MVLALGGEVRSALCRIPRGRRRCSFLRSWLSKAEEGACCTDRVQAALVYLFSASCGPSAYVHDPRRLLSFYAQLGLTRGRSLRCGRAGSWNHLAVGAYIS